MTKKIIKPSIKKEQYGKLKRDITDYDAIFQWRSLPVSQTYIQALADNLMAWADDEEEEALRLDDFVDSRRLHYSTFHQWIAKYECLKEAHAYAKRRIASRREKGALKKQYDSSLTARVIGHYCPEYNEELKKNAEIKAKSLSESGGITGLVPVYMRPPVTDEEVGITGEEE